MKKLLFVTLLAVSSTYSMDSDPAPSNDTSTPWGNDIVSYCNNEPEMSSCFTTEIDWSGPDMVYTSTQEMADNTYGVDNITTDVNLDN